MAKEFTEKTKVFNYGPDQIQKDAGSLSFFTPLGTKHSDVLSVTGTGYPVIDLDSRVAGIQVTRFVAAPGISTDGTSDINIAARKLWSFVRQKNSGARNYDTPDLALYVWSVTSAWGLVFEMVRLYGVIQTYKSKNRYLGRALCEALGYDFSAMESSLSDFRTYINLTITKLNALKIPGDWDILNRLMMLCTNVFKDGEIDKSQLYAFRLEQVWAWNPVGTYVGSLTPVPVAGTGGTALNLTNLKTLVNSVVDSLVADEDTNTMSGDIEKAYADKCFEMQLIPETWRTEPKYSKDALLMQLNASIYPYAVSYTANSGNIIWQNTSDNTIMFDPFVAVTNSDLEIDDKGDAVVVVPNKEYLDMATFKDVTPYDCLVASEMTLLIKYDRTNSAWKYKSAGCLIPTRSNIFCISLASATLIHYPVWRVFGFGLNGSANPTHADFGVMPISLGHLSKFDWHPRTTMWMYIYGNGDGGATIVNNDVCDLFDLGNYTIISDSDLAKLHTAQVMTSMDLNDTDK